MYRALRVLLVTGLLLATQAVVGVSPASADGPGYLTLLMGRTQWVQVTSQCQPYPGAVPLDEVARALSDRRVSATGALVVDRVHESERDCYGNYALMASWADAARLRDEFGWSFVSNGTSHHDIRTMSSEEQWNESCGSLAPLAAHGHNRAWGLFGYGANLWNETVQESIVASCFAYGRTYGGGTNERATTAYPWFQNTNSINGGSCNDSTQLCYAYESKQGTRYASPDFLADLMDVEADHWAVIQMYRFVSGSQLNPDLNFMWDCTSADWRQHWTSHAELYCIEDYLSAIDRIPADVVVTDPATVAEAWGRAHAVDPARSGYWMVDATGHVYAFGGASYRGAPTGMLSSTVADIEATPTSEGYWVIDSGGHVYAFGDAPYLGNADPARLLPEEKVTSLSATPSGRGYWIFTTKGRALAFGDAPRLGGLAGVPLKGPVIDSKSTPSGRGYYMVASDGGVFAFGDAEFHGSMGAVTLNAPVLALVPDHDGHGYWLLASDGGVFAFEAPFRGSLGATRLNRPATGMVGSGNGYLIVAEDGGVFNFSDRPFHGSLGTNPPPDPVVAVAAG
ncbi:MAG: hypothetical protein ACRDQ2_01840 [Gaiellales bacterium]